MIVEYKKIISCLLVVIMFSSCEKKFDFDDYDVTLANLFSGYGEDMEKDIKFLNEKAKTKQSMLLSSPSNRMDSLNTIIDNYYNYLNELDLKSEKLNKNLFYDEDILTEEGKIFKETSERFLTDLNILLKNKDLKYYINHYFRVEDVKNEENFYFVYIEYDYFGIAYPTVKFLIKKRKYDLMMFKNEILNFYLTERN